MTERDQEEQDRRIEQMVVNIEKLRADIRADIRDAEERGKAERTKAALDAEKFKLENDKFRAETKAETRRFVVQALIATAAVFGAGVTVARFIVFRQ